MLGDGSSGQGNLTHIYIDNNGETVKKCLSTCGFHSSGVESRDIFNFLKESTTCKSFEVNVFSF